MKLSVKMSILLGILTFVGISIVNFGTLRLTRLSFTDAMDQNMEDKAKASGEELAAIISKMEGVSSIIDSGIREMGNNAAPAWKVLDLNQEQQAVIPMKESSFRSRVVNKSISSLQYNAESVLIASLSGVVNANEYVTGAGVFFEPNAFLDGVENYAPYIGKANMQNRSIVNYPYEEFKDKPYYTETKEREKTVITDVYESTPDKMKVVTISRPVISNGKFIGAVLLEVDVNLFALAEQTDSRYPSMETEVVDEKQNIVFSKNKDLIGKSFSEEKGEKQFQKLETEMAKGKPFVLLEKTETDKTRRTYYVPTDIMGNVWWIVLSVHNGEFRAPITRIMMLCFALAERVSYVKEDEIGQIGKGFQEVMDRIKDITSDLQEKLAELSQGNFRIDLDNEEKYQGDYRPLMVSMQDIRTALNSTMLEIQKSASEVSESSEQVSSAAQSLSQGATEQASSVEEISAGMNEIAESIKSTTQKAEDAKNLSQMAGQAVMLSTQKMEEMSKAMAEITEKSNEIGKIIKTIDDIAFQTNILSLNAAIEAARAGAAGKGFAVVADEVGNLAQKSAKAAQNTGELIEETKDAVERGARITRETGESLSTVVERAGKINDMIFEITKETERESQNVGQLTKGMEQISSVVQTNSATAEESAASSEELSAQASLLDKLVSKFRLQE